MLKWWTAVMGVCALACPVARGEAVAAGEERGACVVMPGEQGRIAVTATDCRLDDFLLEVSRALECEVYLDPDLRADTINLTAPEQDAERVWAKAFRNYDYVAEWETELDWRGVKKEKLRDLRVFKTGAQEKASYLASRGTIATAADRLGAIQEFSAAELARYRELLSDKVTTQVAPLWGSL